MIITTVLSLLMLTVLMMIINTNNENKTASSAAAHISPSQGRTSPTGGPREAADAYGISYHMIQNASSSYHGMLYVSRLDHII